jgi:3-oxoacyl-ACP reductase-like protein
MSKVDEIKNQLAQRLEKQAERTPPAAPVAAERPQTSAPAAERAAAPRQAPQKAVRTKTDSQQTEVREGVIKVSASLYNFDIECLDRIREFVRGKGIRNVTDSEALRLACRAVKIDDALMGIYEEMTKEDRRRRKQ